LQRFHLKTHPYDACRVCSQIPWKNRRLLPAGSPEISRIAGADILNAWHLPCLGTPPKSGVFFNERAGRLTLTLSWRNTAITPAERDVMLGRLQADLLGTENTEPAHVV